MDLAIDLVVTARQSPEQIVGLSELRNERNFIEKLVVQFMRDMHRGNLVVSRARFA